MQTPEWALTIAFWLHMLATVTWIGSLAALALLILPIAKRRLDAQPYADLLRSINKRLDPINWLGLATLTATGMIQMAANPNYEGFLAVNNAWAQAILIKHIVFGLIILVSAYQSFSLLPAIEHAALLAAKGRESPEQTQLDRKTNQLMRLNLALGVAVLLLTAWARVSA